MIDLETLRRILRYSPDTGVFTWSKPRPKIKVGDRAGYVHHRGYRAIEIDGRAYAEHRLAWFYTHGFWPKEQVDHINRVRDDNRIANLREATNGQNQANGKSISKHGMKGVCFHPWLKEKPWEARIQYREDGTRHHISLGCYPTKEEAHAAYASAMQERYPEHFAP